MDEVRNEGPMTAAARMWRYRARQRGADVPKRKPGPKPRPPAPVPPVDCRSYPLPFAATVLRYVATELERVGPRGANVLELAAGYTHGLHGDLARVRHHHGCVTDTEAVRHLIDRAVRELGGQLREARGVAAGQRVRLDVPFDDLRYAGEGLVRLVKSDAEDAEREARAATVAAAMGYESLT
jgi:hypothetical protein